MTTGRGECLLLATIASMGLIGTVMAEPTWQFTSGDQQTTLIELYTSEGCSSCPPADRWLSELTSDEKLFRDFVPVAFHVDYWDYIGWRDRFADGNHSQRQRRYALEGGTRSVYTPGLFQDGKEWRGWWRGEEPAGRHASVGQLRLEVDGDLVRVSYNDTGTAPRAELAVHVALLGMALESRVTAGENEGRTLHHDFVVLGLRSTPLNAAGRRFGAELPLPVTDTDAPRLAIAAWVSTLDRQAPLQSVGGYLD